MGFSGEASRENSGYSFEVTNFLDPDQIWRFHMIGQTGVAVVSGAIESIISCPG